MAQNVYEGMFILNSNRYGRDSEGVSAQIPEMIEGAGGEMLVSRLWEERRLAYPIKGYRKGTYWLTYFRLESSKLAEIQRRCRLSESILRVLFLKVEPRIADTLVAHAQAGQIGSTREGGKESASRGTADIAKGEAVAAAGDKEPDRPETTGKEE